MPSGAKRSGTETVSGGSTYHVAYGKRDPQGNPEIAQYRVQNLTAYVEQDPVTGQPIMLHTSNDIAALYVYDGTGSPVGLLTDFHPLRGRDETVIDAASVRSRIAEDSSDNEEVVDDR